MTNSTNLTIALVPLDERPVNTRYPQVLGAIAGAEVLLPPAEIQGLQRVPSDTEAVTQWLRETVVSGKAKGVIASTDYLANGNLINARIGGKSASEALLGIKVLEEVGAELPVYAFSLITRVSNADDSVEEPLYWSTYGTRFYKYSQLLHKRDAGELTEDESASLTSLEAELPADMVADWLQRRLRNHTLNLALLDLLARNKLSFLLITSDDTSPWGMPSREKVWLESWLQILGPDAQARTMIHPGADEVGSALVARFICEQRGVRPKIVPLYAVPGGEEITAPYEDRAVRLTVEGQIRACGGELTFNVEEADIVLGVLTPSPRRTEFREDFAASERAEREGYYKTLFQTLADHQRAGRAVAIGDVAYPNGADPLAIEMLLDPASPLDPAALAAFGAWNTAGNTLGVVVAQAVCSLFIEEDPIRARAQAVFLAHRFLEDWGYQTVVRRDARAVSQAKFGTRDPNPTDTSQVAAVAAAAEMGLSRALALLQERGIGLGMRLAPGSVRFPWRRTFEVDFDLV
ncbi:MAG: DUF4127 family protein [Armatimonadota bacterium]